MQKFDEPNEIPAGYKAPAELLESCERIVAGNATEDDPGLDKTECGAILLFEAGELPPPEIFQAMGAFNEELVRAGVMLAAEGLHPTSMGARVVFDGDDVTVLDGPFSEAKEIVAGFWIIQARSKDEAIEWVKRIGYHMKEAGAPAASGETIEIRQIGELSDFGDAIPEEVREQERRLRAQVEGR